jgi:ABC-2 type transport system permease protein
MTAVADPADSADTAIADLAAAEWLKLRTTRLLQGTIPLAVGLSFLAVAGEVVAADGASALESSRGVDRVLAVTGTGALVVLMVGIVVAAGEYRHGTIADTFLPTPDRRRVLAAKLAVGAGLGAAVGLVSGAVSLGVAGVLYRTRGASFPFGDGSVWLTLAGALVYTGLFAVIGVALGALVRNQVLAVALALAWFAVVEHALVNLAPDVGRWLPVAAGQAIVRTPIDDLLSPAAGIAVLAAYAAALAVAGLRLVATRDV